MTMDKTSEEWVVMRYFREKYEDFPKGRLVKSESPDFILKQGPKKQTGIEITRLDYLLSNHVDVDELLPALKNIINRKEDKLRLYRKKKLNEYWLVITIDSMEATNFEHDKIIHLSLSGSLFDKVFFFDLFSGKII